MDTLFFRNRYLLTLSIIVLTLIGVTAYFSLPRLEDPRITNRNPLIITKMPGASPSRVETLVTEKIEDALREIDEIKKIESVSRAGGSVIAIELEDWVGPSENQAIFSRIRNKLDDVGPDLPPSASKPFFDEKRLPAAFTLTVGVVWNGEGPPAYNILNRLTEDLADRIRTVPGTELVRIYGQPKEEVTVVVDQDESALIGIDNLAILQKISDADVKVPAGMLRGRESDILIEVEGELSDTNRIGSIPIITTNNGMVTALSDIASVDRSWKTPLNEIALIDGRPGILLSARMGEGVKIGDWIKLAHETVDQFSAFRAEGIDIVKVFDQSIYTNERLNELEANLLAGAVVVTFIVLFMMGWRSALIVGSALILTISVSLFLLLASQGALHQIAIYGLIVALGLLIDNAIVVVDEVGKRIRSGMDALEAVKATYHHLFVPLFSSTLTTVLGFSPIFLLPGNVGDFVRAIGGSVISAIIASFVISMTIIASLAGIFLARKIPEKNSPWWVWGYEDPELENLYVRILTKLLHRPVLGVFLSLVFPIIGFAVAPTLGSQFFPPIDRNMFDVKLWMPADTSIEETERVAKKAEAYIREFPGVTHVNWMIGNNFPLVYYNQVMIMDFTQNFAQAAITTASPEDTMRIVGQVQDKLDKDLGEAQVVVRKFAQGPPKQADIEYRLFGPSIPRLQNIGERIRLRLQNHPMVLQTQMTIPRGEPKLWFDADEIEASRVGFTLKDISLQLQSNLEGLTSGSMIENLEELDVRVRYGDSIRNSLSAIESINFIQRGSHSWVPLDQLGFLTLKPELGALTRYNGSRCNVIRGFTTDDALPIDVTYEVLAEIKEEGLPNDYRIELGGDAELDNEAIDNLKIYAPILLMLMSATLILSFHSVRLAFLLAIVSFMSIGLGLLSTWFIAFPISFNTILGTLGLIGVAINDSIVVLAGIHSNEKARQGDIPSILHEVVGATRHVLSTTLTTIGGFLPILIFIGGEFWPSLAIVMVGGVSGATLMAILFIPTAYLLILPRKEVAA